MDIQFPQILFQIINFSIVMGALTYLLYKPILKIFDERAERINEGQKAAKKSIEEQEKITELKEKAKKEAQKEANIILAEAKKQADKQKEEILTKAQARVKEDLTKMKQDWESEKKQFQSDMKKEMVKTIMEVSEKVIGTKMSSKSDETLIEKELSSALKQI